MLPTAFNIKATNLALSPEVRAYVEKRFVSLSSVLDFAEPTLKVQIEVGRTTRHHDKGDVFRAEFNVRQKGERLRAVAEAASMYAAIDEARDALESEVVREKKQGISFMRRSSRAMKEAVRGFYGAGLRWVRIPRMSMPRLPRFPHPLAMEEK
jgi:ribosomal subunit interface protein